MKKLLLYTLGGLFLTGCVSSSTQYKKPDKVTIENTKYINQSFDKVWTATSNSFFNGSSQLNDMNKAKGVITAEFTSNRPVNYIDCGIMTRRFKAEKPFKKYTYNLADSIEYLYDEDHQIYDTKVDSSLTANIKATVAASGSGTNVTIDIDYTLTQNIESKNKKDGTIKNSKKEVTFSTTAPFKDKEFNCISNGALENSILEGTD